MNKGYLNETKRGWPILWSQRNPGWRSIRAKATRPSFLGLPILYDLVIAQIGMSISQQFSLREDNALFVVPELRYCYLFISRCIFNY